MPSDCADKEQSTDRPNRRRKQGRSRQHSEKHAGQEALKRPLLHEEHTPRETEGNSKDVSDPAWAFVGGLGQVSRNPGGPSLAALRPPRLPNGRMRRWPPDWHIAVETRGNNACPRWRSTATGCRLDHTMHARAGAVHMSLVSRSFAAPGRPRPSWKNTA